MKSISIKSELEPAYEGSWYTISGAGGDLNEWVDGYNKLLVEQEIGTPVEWYVTNGASVNLFAGETNNPFPLSLAVLLFPLEGLNVGKLAMFKLQMQDRWFDDVIDNMRR